MDRKYDSDAAFKVCANCENSWSNREDFLEDPAVRLVGYQAHFEELETGLFLFNHACANTLALHAAQFTDLYDGPVFKNCKHGSEECPGYCLHTADLRPCPVRCECAFVREILHMVHHWPKQGDQAA